MLFFPVSYCFFFLRSKYWFSPQCPVLRHPQCLLFPWSERPFFLYIVIEGSKMLLSCGMSLVDITAT
jgi:hypothetical protein